MSPGRCLTEGQGSLHISKTPAAKCDDLHNRLLVLLTGMILSSQLSNARWALSLGNYKEINMNKKRANSGGSEAAGTQQATRGRACQQRLWGPQPGSRVCSFSFIRPVTFTWPSSGFSCCKKDSALKHCLLENTRLHKKPVGTRKKSCPAS